MVFPFFTKPTFESQINTSFFSTLIAGSNVIVFELTVKEDNLESGVKSVELEKSMTNLKGVGTSPSTGSITELLVPPYVCADRAKG